MAKIKSKLSKSLKAQADSLPPIPNPAIPGPSITDPIQPDPGLPNPTDPGPHSPTPSPLPPDPKPPQPDPNPKLPNTHLHNKFPDVALKGGYLIQNKLLNRLVSLCDWMLERTISRLINQGQNIPPPKRLLLANFAHLGDAILTTSLLAPLKASFPDLEIGVLIGSWSRAIFEKHPLVSHIHELDHPFLIRKKASLFKKGTHFLVEETKVLSEIARIGYDTAVDLRFHFPSSASLLVRSKIPVRLGFKTAGLSSLLTHPVPWTSPTCAQNNWSTLDYFKNILSRLPGASFPLPLKPMLPPQNPRLSEEIKRRFNLNNKDYLVLHMGSGSPIKAWPKEKWKAIAKRLVDKGEKIVFTGKGAQETRDIIEVRSGLEDRSINLADQLSWHELVCLITNAKMLLSVDTSAGHVAAAVDTPALLLFTGIYPTSLWAPPSPLIQTLTHPVVCSPCYKGRGCSSMACLKNLEVDDVYRMLLQMLMQADDKSYSSNALKKTLRVL